MQELSPNIRIDTNNFGNTSEYSTTKGNPTGDSNPQASGK